MSLTFEQARAAGRVYVVGCDPGPVSSALSVTRLEGKTAELCAAVYVANADFALAGGLFGVKHSIFPEVFKGFIVYDGAPFFLAYESCGAQGKFVGESTFETAAMGGEIRRAFRPFVKGTYVFKPSDWRYALCGRGNAKTPDIYAEFRGWFRADGPGSDPLKGAKGAPGPLAVLHEAGKGGNMEHMKDSLGVALALDRVRYRSGRDPEEFRRPF